LTEQTALFVFYLFQTLLGAFIALGHIIDDASRVIRNFSIELQSQSTVFDVSSG